MGFFPRFMDTVGDGSGETNIATAVGTPANPEIFRIKPAEGELLFLSRLIFYLQDSGTIDAGGFGNGVALTNGLIFRFQYGVGTGIEDTYPDPTFKPITQNQHWKKYCHDLTVAEFGSGDNSFSARYTFAKDVNGETRQLPWLSDARLEEFQLVVQDDINARGITEITCRVGMFTY